MSKLNQIIANIPELNPAPSLEQAVLRKIRILEEAKVKRAQRWSLASFAGSLWAFAYVLAVFGPSFWQSEFWSILSLAFSDARVVVGNWQEFGYSVLETLPVVSVLAMFVPTIALLWSFGKYFEGHHKFNNKYVIN